MLDSDSEPDLESHHSIMKRITSYPSLKAWRTALDLSQSDAAKLLGMTQSLYSKTESGQNAPRPKRAKSISNKTGVPFEAVMGVA